MQIFKVNLFKYSPQSTFQKQHLSIFRAHSSPSFEILAHLKLKIEQDISNQSVGDFEPKPALKKIVQKLSQLYISNKIKKK